MTCRTATERLTRDWTRVLVARRREYFPERLAVFTRDVDALNRLEPVCPGREALGALTRTVSDLRRSAAGRQTCGPGGASIGSLRR